MTTGIMLSYVVGCGGGSAPSATSSSSPPATRSAATPLTASMSIADHAVLSQAVPWEVTVKLAENDIVNEVDYLIDGKKRWVEEVPPFFFNDDDQLLAPWILGNGDHVLAAHVVTLNGATTDATARVRVRAGNSAHNAIVGTYRRTVTKADQQRVTSYRVPSKGAFGEISPTGTWTMHIQPNGEIIGVDPDGDTAKPFVEPYRLSGATMTMYGAAVWDQPNPDEPNLFCEPERPSDYSWQLSGPKLTITGKQKVCADRDIVFVGTWTRV